MQTFADQAVIAIQNVRLFNETKEALERQTATADILKVIASSPDDVQPVFEAIAERSNRIVEGRATAVYSLEDGILHLMAFTPTSSGGRCDACAFFPRPLSQLMWGEAIGRGEMVQIPDLQDLVYPAGCAGSGPAARLPRRLDCPACERGQNHRRDQRDARCRRPIR